VILLVFGRGDRWMGRWGRWSAFGMYSPAPSAETTDRR